MWSLAYVSIPFVCFLPGVCLYTSISSLRKEILQEESRQIEWRHTRGKGKGKGGSTSKGSSSMRTKMESRKILGSNSSVSIVYLGFGKRFGYALTFQAEYRQGVG
jgi:hypothetical protein